MRHTLGRRAPKFELRDLFDKNRIALVSLAKGQLGPESAALLGSLVVALLWDTNTARSAVESSRRTKVGIYIDEVQDHLRLPGALGDARAQQVRAARRNSGERPRVHSHYLKGTLYSGNCGEPLTFEQSRNRVGTLYDYFYCLGRQRLKNGCTFKATQAHMVEDLVEQHWSTVTIYDERLSEVRRFVLEHMDTLLPNQDRAEAKAKRDLADLQT